MKTRAVLGTIVAAVCINMCMPSNSRAVPLIAVGDLLEPSSLVQEARVYCYDRYSGRFKHWGPCRRVPRVYCRNRYTGQFLHWGSCRRW
jgi:hypothetical protein